MTALLAAALPVLAAQPPKVQWTKTFAGWGTSDGVCVQQVSDGYIVVGNTSSGDSTPDGAILLAKVNSVGTKVWQKVIKAHGVLLANSVLQTADGGYVVAGMGTLEEPADARVCLVKTDGQGNVLWQRAVNQTSFAQGRSVVEMDDHGLVAVAQRPVKDTGLLLYRTDANGNGSLQPWGQYPVAYRSSMPMPASLRRTSDGGFIMGTKTLLKTNSQGTQQWLKTYAGLQYASCAIPTSDGGYAAVGPTAGYTGIGLLKTNANGDIANGAGWLKTYALSNQSLGDWVEQTTDGGYIVAGEVEPGKNVWGKAVLVRMSADGTLSWTDTLGIGGTGCVRQTSDGGYIVAGGRFDPSAGSEGVNYMFLTKLAPELGR